MTDEPIEREALGGHYPADLLLRELEKKYEGRIGDMLFYGGGTIDILKEELADLARDDPELEGHGGMWETAFVMAARPDWADLSRAEQVMESPFASQLQMMSRESLARIKEATREFGELFMGRAAEKVASRAKSLLEEAQR
jgi:creatinine amidohydrolase/Fe(II)-dependent formamide hydrolase-like protein